MTTKMLTLDLRSTGGKQTCVDIHKRPLMTTDGLHHERALGRGKLGCEDRRKLAGRR
jgi:hypothetical protein